MFPFVFLSNVVSSHGIFINGEPCFSRERAGVSVPVAKSRQVILASVLNYLREKNAVAVCLNQLSHCKMQLLADFTSSLHTLSITTKPVLPLTSFSRSESALGAVSDSGCIVAGEHRNT